MVDLQIRDRYNLGGQFFLWELATAIAGYRLGIQPFDQPNVESAKLRARQMVAAYKAKGKLPAEAPLLERDGVQVYGDATKLSVQKHPTRRWLSSWRRPRPAITSPCRPS